jgi:hypothetical protein
MISVNRICPVCNSPFQITPYQDKHGLRKTCSVRCKIGKSIQETEYRLYSYIDKDNIDGHHLWTAARDTAGYGRFSWNGKLISVHKFILEQKIGRKLVPGEVARHTEGHQYFKHCCNPEHLLIGTQKQNIQDAIEEGTLKIGQKHYRTELNDEVVKDIKILLSKNVSAKEIRDKYSISTKALSFIKMGLTWKHIPWPNGFDPSVFKKDKSSMYRGVYFNSGQSHTSKPWGSYHYIDGKQKFLGYFSTEEEAHEAYCQAGRELHGEFFRAGESLETYQKLSNT